MPYEKEDKSPKTNSFSKPPEWDNLREKIIGLGDYSIQKSYYPELQERLRELERFRAILDQSNDSIFLLESSSGFIRDLNRSAHEGLGYSREEILELSLEDILIPEEYARNLNWIQDMIKEDNKTVETVFKDKNSDEFPVEISTSVVSFGDEVYVVMVARDITDRKKAEKQLKASLDEKNVLLREIHHRVKNNMQVISSLLSLQSHYIDGKNPFDVFKESQNRVKSMAMIHEMLYQSRDLARVDFREYIQRLINFLFHSYAVNPRLIRIHVQLRDIELGIDNAIPLGLIINEIVTNSLKHAFQDEEGGNIFLELNQQGNKYILNVRDDGKGLPSDMDVKNTNSLGMRLINTLVNQLDGKLQVGDQEGTEFKIEFTDLEPTD
ncbi:MAG TPA: histidine kinase dimerization/phosphoacceptor domain -containing protein [Methanobacteriaceae archaeon]|nr:histidine kinase dimerization/phosphoacceptor domain -containing protein [Methanobacteriaceae archaeon]